MPKGLWIYFTALFFLCFFLLFSMPNLWGHWTDLNQTWTPIHLWLPFEKLAANFPGIYPHGLEAKTPFWDQLWTVTEHNISATEHDINNRKETYLSTGTSLHVPPEFGELWSRNGWERLVSFCPSPKFLHWETLPALPSYRMDVI